MKIKSKFMLATTLTLLMSGITFAEDGRSDYDLDDDGLIEINDLGDLDEIRNNTDGSSLYGSSDGCPTEGCNGYELTTNLNFDTNGDGVVDENDDFWTSFQQGWLPINMSNATFDGNNFEIQNLTITINRGTSRNGLFGTLNNVTVRNLGLTGPLSKIIARADNGFLTGYIIDGNVENVYSTGEVNGWERTGGIIGEAIRTTISNSYSTGNIEGEVVSVGGLVGRMTSSTLTQSYATGNVTGVDQFTSYVGGLVGRATSGSLISQSYATGNVSGERSVGGLVGHLWSGSDIIGNFATGNVQGPWDVGGLAGVAFNDGNDSAIVENNFALGNVTGVGGGAGSIGGLIGTSGLGAVVNNNYIINSVSSTLNNSEHFIGSAQGIAGTNNYWASDVVNPSLSSTEGFSEGFLLSELQCPTSANNTTCSSSILYQGWDFHVDANGDPVWHFGTSSQLPGLRINGKIFRDGNGVVELPGDLYIVEAGEAVDSASVIHEGDKGNNVLTVLPEWDNTRLDVSNWNTSTGNYTSLVALTRGTDRDSDGMDLSAYNNLDITYRCHQWATIEAFFGSDKDSSQNFLGDLNCDTNWNTLTVDISAMDRSDIATALWMYAPDARNTATDIIWGYFFMQMREVKFSR